MPLVDYVYSHLAQEFTFRLEVRIERAETGSLRRSDVLLGGPALRDPPSLHIDRAFCRALCGPASSVSDGPPHHPPGPDSPAEESPAAKLPAESSRAAESPAAKLPGADSPAASSPATGSRDPAPLGLAFRIPGPAASRLLGEWFLSELAARPDLRLDVERACWKALARLPSPRRAGRVSARWRRAS